MVLLSNSAKRITLAPLSCSEVKDACGWTSRSLDGGVPQNVRGTAHSQGSWYNMVQVGRGNGLGPTTLRCSAFPPRSPETEVTVQHSNMYTSDLPKVVSRAQAGFHVSAVLGLGLASA